MQMVFVRLFLAFFWLWLISYPAVASDVYVVDGDTITIENISYRFWGIDAPEKGQICFRRWKEYQCGIEARDALIDFIDGREVVCEPLEVKYRIIAKCYAQGVDIAAYMVRIGYALDYKRYSGGAYHEEEKKARQEKAGLWIGKFDKPWDWRRKRD